MAEKENDQIRYASTFYEVHKNANGKAENVLARSEKTPKKTALGKFRKNVLYIVFFYL